jgi:hypothetical protein
VADRYLGGSGVARPAEEEEEEERRPEEVPECLAGVTSADHGRHPWSAGYRKGR